ncbi:Os02g0460600, partial [Oryza sativa Japonica Group]
LHINRPYADTTRSASELAHSPSVITSSDEFKIRQSGINSRLSGKDRTR